MAKGIRRFKMSLWGFNKRDVTSYLSTIFDETERVLEDNERILGRVLSEAEIQAELRAKAIILDAEIKAQAIISQAELESVAIRQENDLIRCHNMELLESAERAILRLKSDIDRLQHD